MSSRRNWETRARRVPRSLGSDIRRGIATPFQAGFGLPITSSSDWNSSSSASRSGSLLSSHRPGSSTAGSEWTRKASDSPALNSSRTAAEKAAMPADVRIHVTLAPVRVSVSHVAPRLPSTRRQFCRLARSMPGELLAPPHGKRWAFRRAGGFLAWDRPRVGNGSGKLPPAGIGPVPRIRMVLSTSRTSPWT